MQMLEAIRLPKQVAFIHCRAHQKGEAEILRGNNRADMAAKPAAEDEDRLQMPLLLVPQTLTQTLHIYPRRKGKGFEMGLF